MLSSLRKYKDINISNKNKNKDRDLYILADIFRTVESTDQCLNLFHTHGFLGNFGLINGNIEVLANICRLMRSTGMALEPNLIGRTVASAIINRKLASETAIVFAKLDNDFCEHITRADTARDRGDFHEAQYRYWCALELFPMHSSYRTQYAHCLKERGLMKEALVEYIDAHCFGATKKDVEPHALFAAQAINLHENVIALFKKSVPDNQKTLDELVTQKDAIVLTRLLLNRDPSIDEIVHFMCTCKNKRQLFHTLMDHKDFTRAHKKTLCLLSEINWNAI